MFGEQRLTYADLDRKCNLVARALISEGVQRGDRVAICLGNCIETVIAIFAVLKAGAVYLPINPTTKRERLAYILNNCQARAMIVAAEKLTELQQSWPVLPYLDTIYVIGAADASVPGSVKSLSFDSILMGTSGGDGSPAKQCIDIDLAMLIYTSGSTGKPKGVMLTHLNLVSATDSITTYLENTCTDVILNVLPLSFSYGLTQVLTAVKVGATLVLEESFAFPVLVLRRLAKEHVTGFAMVPTIAAMLLQMNLEKHDLSSIRYVTNAAAPLSTEHLRKLQQTLPRARIYSMHGLTECIRTTYLPPQQILRRPSSVGKGMPNVELYLVNEKGDRIIEPGVVGELVVRGSNVMRGYWEMPEETDRALRPGTVPGEKVLYSGDLFRMDEEGYLYFVSRKDDIIKTRGEKVSPKEVEDVLYALEEISEAAVVGVPDETLGNVIKAVITLRPGYQLTEQKVLRHCADHLSDFMIPKIVEFRDELPKTASGKIFKLELKVPVGESL